MIIKKIDEPGAIAAAAKVVEVYQRLVHEIQVGQKLPQIDQTIQKIIEQLKCKSCFFRYRIPHKPPFPSQACLSVNDCIVHGTAGYYNLPLKEGDLLKVDIGISYQGWLADVGWTFSIRSFASEQAERLMACGKRSLLESIDKLRHGRPASDWADSVQNIVESEGFHVCRYFGGHGYGKKLHEPPHISNRRSSDLDPWPEGQTLLQKGMLLAVEPMIAAGTHEVRSTVAGWPAFTADGSLTAHYEADILIQEDGPVNLTAGMNNLPEIIG
jgi:methionyl aminopeptidase